MNRLAVSLLCCLSTAAAGFAQGPPPRELPKPKSVRSVTFAPSNSRAIFHYDEDELLRTLPEFQPVAGLPVFSHRRERLLGFVSDDEIVIHVPQTDDGPADTFVWDLAGRKRRLTFEAKGYQPESAWLSANGNAILIGYEDGSVKYFDASVGKLLRTVFEPRRVNDFFLPTYRPGLMTNTRAAWGDSIDGARLWEQATTNEKRDRLQYRQCAIAVSTDGRIAATSIGTVDYPLMSQVAVWDISTARKRFDLLSNRKIRPPFYFTSDGKYLMTGLDADLARWDLSTGKLAMTLPIRCEGVVGVSPDGRFVVAQYPYGLLKLWNLERPSFPRLLHQDSQFPVDVSVYRELAAALTYHDVSIRRAAANDLRQLYYFYDSPRSDEKDRILRPAVTAALEDRDVWVRLFTANAMMRFGASSLVIPALDREFSGGDVEIRRHIVQMLWSSGVHRPLLLRAIRDPDVQIRRIASNRFRYEHNLDQQSRLLLKSSLCDSDFQVRLNIASALCDSVTAESGIRSKYEWNKGDDTPRLCARIAIESFARPVIESHEIAVPLFKSLAASNPEVFVELKSECLRHLKHADHSVRMANATALHAMQAEDDAVVSTIVEILADPKRWETYRHDCTQILFRMGPKAKAAIPTLIAMLGKPIGYVDYTLSKLGPDVIPALKPLLTASSDNDRMNAIRVCRWLGPMAKDLVPLIIPAIRELPASNKLDRFDAISVLGLIGPDAGEAMPLLLVYIDDKENKYGVRGRSVEILLKLGPKAKMALPLIREMAAEPNAGPFIKSTLKALEELP